jgi:hypothetical protein
VLTSSKSDFGEGGESNDRGAPVTRRYSAIGTARSGVVEGPSPSHHHIHQKEVHMQNVYIKTCVLPRQRERILISKQTGYWRRARRCVRLAEWVPPVGGALSRHTSTWQGDRRGRVVPRSKQSRRCQATEGGRRPGAPPRPGGKNTPLVFCVLRRPFGELAAFRALL